MKRMAPASPDDADIPIALVLNIRSTATPKAA